MAKVEGGAPSSDCVVAKHQPGAVAEAGTTTRATRYCDIDVASVWEGGTAGGAAGASESDGGSDMMAQIG